MYKLPVYLIEKSSGQKDENGVDMWLTLAVKLTRVSAENYAKKKPMTRVRKIIADKL